MGLSVVEREEFNWQRVTSANPQAAARVAEIIEDVRRRGDVALQAWTKELDGQWPASLRVPESALKQALEAMPEATRLAMEQAAARIRRYHEAQWPEDFTLYGDDGEQLGLLWRAMDRVGVYAPGGRGAYPSTVLMDVIPA